MRKLKKSFWPGADYAALLLARKSNTSTKPHARLMHALYILTDGDRSFKFGPLPPEFKTARMSSPNPNYVTGSVRRGLERGRVA